GRYRELALENRKILEKLAQTEFIEKRGPENKKEK
ncbi:MAG: hypothetical protein ACD_51C00342G0001, partial [uncultured bacterium]